MEQVITNLDRLIKKKRGVVSPTLHKVLSWLTTSHFNTTPSELCNAFIGCKLQDLVFQPVFIVHYHLK